MGTKRTQFGLGRLLSTPGAVDALRPEDVLTALGRRTDCDWGDCRPEDWSENDFALDKYLRLFSVYHDRHGSKFWKITEADRLAATVLLPSEH